MFIQSGVLFIQSGVLCAPAAAKLRFAGWAAATEAAATDVTNPDIASAARAGTATILLIRMMPP